jgi:hypothetical protein
LKGWARRSLLLAILLGLMLGSGCATTSVKAGPPPPKRHRVKHSPSLQIKRVPRPHNVVNRDELDRALEEGIGRFLQRVRVAPARDPSGQFVGYQILELFPGENRRIDCPRPGDVLRTVNGTPISRPDELYGIWQTLGRVDRIDILVMRGGQPVQCAFHVRGERKDPRQGDEGDPEKP